MGKPDHRCKDMFRAETPEMDPDGMSWSIRVGGTSSTRQLVGAQNAEVPTAATNSRRTYIFDKLGRGEPRMYLGGPAQRADPPDGDAPGRPYGIPLGRVSKSWARWTRLAKTGFAGRPTRRASFRGRGPVGINEGLRDWGLQTP